MIRGHQTQTGLETVSCSTGSWHSPSQATTLHITPVQNHSQGRAIVRTSAKTVLACLIASLDYTAFAAHKFLFGHTPYAA